MLYCKTENTTRAIMPSPFLVVVIKRSSSVHERPISEVMDVTACPSGSLVKLS